MTPPKAPLAPPKAPSIPPPQAPASSGTGNVANLRSQTIKRPGKLERRALGRRIILTGVEGVGKTSFVAYAPNPCIIMAGDETGYETLLLNNRVPDVDTVQVLTWQEILSTVQSIVDDGTKYGVIGIDTIGGTERLCHEYVCDTQFGGDWGEKGFIGFQRGFDVSITEWKRLLSILDKLKVRGTHVVLLAHMHIRPFGNPMGPSYDQYKADLHHKTWAATHRWADAAFFVNYLSDVVKNDPRDKKGKGLGVDTPRMCYTKRRDAFDAKNRYGMPPVIQLPDDPADMWNTLDYYMSGGQPE